MMPLTFSPDESEDRRLKKFAALAQGGDKAMALGMGALEKMEALAKAKGEATRQAGLDKDKRTTDAAAESRAAATHGITLEREKRDASKATADATRAAFDLEQAEAGAVRDADDRTMKLEKTHRDDARQIIKEAVAAGIARGEDPDTISTAIQNRSDVEPFAPGRASLLDVDAEWRAQKDANFDREGVRDLRSSQIAENEAQAAKAARVPTGGGGNADLKRRLLEAQVANAEGRDPAAKVEAEDVKRGKEEKKLKERQMVEIDTFVANIKDNINSLRAQVKEDGTFEMFGPGSANMERYLTGIATDLAKLADPGSVAREGEVALQRRGLFDPNTLSVRNATAGQILDQLEKDIEKKRQNAMAKRGLTDAPVVGSVGGGATNAMTDDDAAALDAYLGGG